MLTCFLATALSVTITLITAADAAPAQVATATSRGGVGWVEFLNLDKTWTSGDPKNEHGPQILASTVLASRVSLDAERTGFEPAEDLRPHGFSKPALSTTQPPLLNPYAARVYVFFCLGALLLLHYRLYYFR